MTSARVLADSLSVGGIRLTTLEVTLPRIVLAELNTHRMFSRNSASSRAIPVERQIERVRENPFIPEEFGKNQKGMQSDEVLNDKDQGIARRVWMLGIERAIDTAEQLVASGVHKQWANRVLEPYTWQTVLVSSTEWSNFFTLRMSAEAQPEIFAAAKAMLDAMNVSKPRQINFGEWHLPLIDDDEIEEIKQASSHPEFETRMISAGRCARVSYLTHDGRRDFVDDSVLANRLRSSGHWSPFEHVATPLTYANEWDSNFRGWRQFRSELERDNNVVSILTARKPKRFQSWKP